VPAVGLDPEVVELLRLHELTDGALHELADGLAERRDQDLSLRRQRGLGQLGRVDHLHELVGEPLGHRVGDLGVVRQGSDCVDPRVRVQERPVSPHPDRAGQDREAREHGEDDHHDPSPARPDLAGSDVRRFELRGRGLAGADLAGAALVTHSVITVRMPRPPAGRRRPR
jgi:hypothetical protein